MKKGFTLIEAVIVIVVIGILSSIAIPKLFLNRNNAQIAKVRSNIETFVNDITNFYFNNDYRLVESDKTTNTDIINSLAQMTYLNIDKDFCINSTNCNENKCLTIQKIESKSVTMVPTETGLCQKVWDSPSLKSLKLKLENKSNKFEVIAN